MNSKTPKFDKALEGILNNLKPHQKECRECGEIFDIFKEDIQFYKKLQVPPPSLCWRCRSQRRLGYKVSFLPNFYKKSCSAPGHNEKIVTYYSEKNPVKVYDDDYYLSDRWDSTQFGVDFISEKSFFKQYKKVELAVPHQSLFKDPKAIDSDYVISGTSSKNCYYMGVPYFSENIYYGHLAVSSKDCINIFESMECEKCFDIMLSIKGYNLIFCVDITECVDSAFLYDCKNCSDCFMSSNLRHKKYYFYNQRFSKEAYKNKIKEINLGSRRVYEKHKKEFGKMLSNTIYKNVINLRASDCLGSGMVNSKNCFQSFNNFNCENNRYASSADRATDSMDVYGMNHASELYETAGVGPASKSKFSVSCRQVVEVEYSSECNNCENCFACFGLKNKKYHIFNKEYTKEEYWKKVDELKTKMLERGEYGEFFPLKDSPFPYQDSNAQVEFPMTEKEIKEKGWHWQDEIKSDIDLTKVKTLKAEDVPNNIQDVKDDILKTPIICERTGKPFKITKFELDFYRKMNVPLPIISPVERIKDLFQYRRPYKLYDTICAKCQKEIQTVHNPESTENIYCEECYNKEVV